jgi:hypothetical protein
MLEYFFLYYYVFANSEQTHKIFSFHPATVILHDIEVKAPWNCQEVLYPSPHPIFLKMHYLTSISRGIRDSRSNCKLDDGDGDNNNDSEYKA